MNTFGYGISLDGYYDAIENINKDKLYKDEMKSVSASEDPNQRCNWQSSFWRTNYSNDLCYVVNVLRILST